MQETPKLKLKKPGMENYVNINDLNDNMDILDDAVSEAQEKVDDVEETVATHLADYAQFKSDITQEVSGARTSLINSHNSIAEM